MSEITLQLFHQYNLKPEGEFYKRCCDIESEYKDSRRLHLSSAIPKLIEENICSYLKKQTESHEASQLASFVVLSSYRNERNVMAFPLFATETNSKRIEPIEYEFIDTEGNRRYLHVTANATYGMATQRDGDILRFVISKIGEVLLREKKLADYVELTRRELLEGIGKDDQRNNYVWLEGALDRLSSTVYKTNIFSSNPRNSNLELSGSIVQIERLYTQDKELKTIRFYPALHILESIKRKNILAIPKEIIFESGNFKKRLLEVVQVHAGDKKAWKVQTSKLMELCATTMPTREFKRRIKEAGLPFEVKYSKGTNGELINFAIK